LVPWWFGWEKGTTEGAESTEKRKGFVMPHDRNGKPLKAGDEVILRAKVTEVYPQEDACNANVEIIDVNLCGQYAGGPITCNTQHMELVEG